MYTVCPFISFYFFILATFLAQGGPIIYVHYLKALPKYTDVIVSNDLAKTERARKKELWEEAKKMNDKDDSGDYKYKMMG
jgi:hypothetical protein